MNEINGYEMLRQLFDWSYENPDMINTNHIAIYAFCIDHWNRLGQKSKFGLPSGMTMEAVGIKNYKTYSKTFNDLTEWGFLKLVQKSKNQYSANVVALVKNTKAHTKALTKASTKHVSKHIPKQVQSIVGIEYPIDTIEPINPIDTIDTIDTQKRCDYSFDLFWNDYDKKVGDRKKIETKFNAIKNQEREKIRLHIISYKQAQPEKQFRKNPETYINQKSWNDEIIQRYGNTEIQPANSTNRKNTFGNNAEERKRGVDNLAAMAEAILQNT